MGPGAGLAAFGAGLSIAAIWATTVADQPGYSADRGASAYLLALGVASGALVLRRSARGWAVVAGLLIVGFHAFVPLVYFPDRLGELRAGAWLGLVAGALVAGGAGVAYLADRREGEGSRARIGPFGLAAGAAGSALAIAAVWGDVVELRAGISFPREIETSYWNYYVTGHELGMFIVVTTGVAAVLLFAGRIVPDRWLLELARLPALLLLGLVLVAPVLIAFDFGDLGTGAWLALAGAALLVAGSTLTPRGSRS